MDVDFYYASRASILPHFFSLPEKDISRRAAEAQRNAEKKQGGSP
jgi:hypothetical protein